MNFSVKRSKSVQPFSVLVVLLSLGVLLSLTACDFTRNTLKHDREHNSEFQEVRDAMAAAPMPDRDESDDSIPPLESYIKPPADDMKPMPLVSISVNQTVPLQDALYELANEADYDLVLDPRITGSIIFTARNKPLDTVIDRMCEIAGLRYNFDDEVLRIEVDTPYLKTYKVDYLNIVRSSTSNVQNSSTVSNEENDAGSNFSASNDSEADFWGELETALEQILDMRDFAGRLKTFFTPQLTAVVSNPAQVAPVVTQGPDGVAVTVTPPTANLQVNQIPVDAEEQGVDDDEIDAADLFSINKNAGLLTIFATERKHREVSDYLAQLKRATTAQVLIEAKVLEIVLSDEFNSGVDWGQFVPNEYLDIDLIGGGTGVTGGSSITLGRAGTDTINAAVEALQVYGTVRALASPRLTVLNNQSSVLNVSKNLVFFSFEVEIAEGEDGDADVPVIESQIETAPEGVLINVQPVINLDDRTISMAIRPTVTKAVDFELDPTLALNFDGGDIPENRIPVIQIQEFDSIIDLQDGQVAILGGLLNDSVTTEDSGVPVLSEVPVLGNLFKTQDDTISKSELIILLKASIIDRGDTNIHQKDKDFYRRFSGDRRPFDL